jgi:hypothetical protein
MTNDWFEEFLATHTRIVMSERVEIPANDEDLPPYVDAEIVSAVSWNKLLTMAELNNIKQTDKYRIDFALATPKGRGRVAMNIGNSLRGAARRRGGLYAMDETGKRVWHDAPDSWLKVMTEYDFSQPVEDRDGNPL